MRLYIIKRDKQGRFINGSKPVMSLETRKKISKNNSKFWLGKTRPEILGRTGCKGYKHSQEAILKIREARARQNLNGSNSHFWRGGITKENIMIRRSFEYKEWRQKVFIRDNFVCQHFGQVGGRLNADHIKSFSQFPELRFTISNGRTLCEPCHRKTNTFGGNSRRKK